MLVALSTLHSENKEIRRKGQSSSWEHSQREPSLRQRGGRERGLGTPGLIPAGPPGRVAWGSEGGGIQLRWNS